MSDRLPILRIGANLALRDGWSSGRGMGLGLSGARRLVDEFELHTVVDQGTTVTVIKWAR